MGLVFFNFLFFSTELAVSDATVDGGAEEATGGSAGRLRGVTHTYNHAKCLRVKLNPNTIAINSKFIN